MNGHRGPECIDAEVGDLLIDYVRSSLGEAERASFEAHLAACLACEQQVVPMRRLLAALANLPPSPALALPHVRRFSMRVPRRRLSLVAAAAAVLTFALLASARFGARSEPVDAFASEMEMMRARIARLERQDARILGAMDSAASAGVSVQPVYGRMPIPPNL